MRKRPWKTIGQVASNVAAGDTVIIRGNGIWFDIGNENCTVRQCLIADNEDSGIFHEISFGLLLERNYPRGPIPDVLLGVHQR